MYDMTYALDIYIYIAGRGARSKKADRGHAQKKQKRGEVCEYGGYECI